MIITSLGYTYCNDISFDLLYHLWIVCSKMFKVTMVAMTHIHNIFTTLGLSKNPTGWHFHSDFLQQLHQGAISGDRSGSAVGPYTAYRRRPRRPHFLRVQSVGIGVTSWRQEKVGSDLPPLVGLKMGYMFHMKMGHFPMKMGHFPYENGTFPYENVENVDVHRENECSPSDCPVFLDVPGLHFGCSIKLLKMAQSK